MKKSFFIFLSLIFFQTAFAETEKSPAYFDEGFHLSYSNSLSMNPDSILLLRPDVRWLTQIRIQNDVTPFSLNNKLLDRLIEPLFEFRYAYYSSKHDIKIEPYLSFSPLTIFLGNLYLGVLTEYHFKKQTETKKWYPFIGLDIRLFTFFSETDVVPIVGLPLGFKRFLNKRVAFSGSLEPRWFFMKDDGFGNIKAEIALHFLFANKE